MRKSIIGYLYTLSAVILCSSMLCGCGAFDIYNSITSSDEHIEQDIYEKTIPKLERAIASDPQNYEPYEELVNIYLDINNEKTKDGIIETVRTYHNAVPSDDKLTEYVLANINRVSVSTARAVFDELRTLTDNPFLTAAIVTEVNNIDQKIFEGSVYLPLYKSLVYSLVETQDKYWLNNFDGDGTPELVTACGESEWFRKYLIYRYSDSKLKCVYDGMSWPHAIKSFSNDNKILSFYHEKDLSGYTVCMLKGEEFTLEEDLCITYVDGEEDAATINSEPADPKNVDEKMVRLRESIIEVPWKTKAEFDNDIHEIVKKWILEENPDLADKIMDKEDVGGEASADIGKIFANAKATLENYDYTYEHIIYDVDADGLKDLLIYNNSVPFKNIEVKLCRNNNFVDAGYINTEFGLYENPDGEGLISVQGVETSREFKYEYFLNKIENNTVKESNIPAYKTETTENGKKISTDYYINDKNVTKEEFDSKFANKAIMNEFTDPSSESEYDNADLFNELASAINDKN